MLSKGTDQSLTDVVNCSCGNKLKTKETRLATDPHGRLTSWRRKTCDTCSYRITTIEVPAPNGTNVNRESGII